MTLSFLMEMGWKSALIAGAALLLVTLLRSRAPADRAAILRLAVTLLLILPVIAYALPALELEVFYPEPVAATSEPLPAPANVQILLPGLQDSAEPMVVEADPAQLAAWPSAESVVAMLYLVGLFLLGLRLAIGILTLREWTRRGQEVTSGRWANALAFFDSEVTHPRLILSKDVTAPMSWGWRNTVILVDPASLDRPEDAEAIIAHEMAHLERRDWVTLILSRLSVAIFWFNPLVWLVEREILQQAEEAADARALGLVEPTRYAETLVTCARGLGGIRVPAHGIAPSGSSLARRIKAVLEGRSLNMPSGSRWTRIAMIMCAAFAAPVAALELIPAAALPAVAAPLAAGTAAPSVSLAAAAPRTAPLASMFASVVGSRAADALEAHPHENVDVNPVVRVEVDEQAIQRQVEAATRSAGLSEEESERLAERIEAQVERQVEQAAARAERDAERVAERLEARAEASAGELSDRISRNVAASMARSMGQFGKRSPHGASGADGMLQGAVSMEREAQRLEAEAARLSQLEYRLQRIAEAKHKGRIVTEHELLSSIAGLKGGAKGLREGAAEMRRGAEEMRRSGI